MGQARSAADGRRTRADALARVLAAPEGQGRLNYIPAPGAEPTATARWEAEETLEERKLRLREEGEREQVVGLTATTLASGGARFWFLCPGLGCGRRVGALFCPPGESRWRCRHCCDLRYASQRETRRSRSIIRMVAARMGIAASAARWITRTRRAPGWVLAR